MKKLFTHSILPVLTLAFAMNMVSAPKANAAMALGAHFDGVGALVCLILLPICLLDEKVDGVNAATAQNLVDNGYTPAEAHQIVSENQALAQSLAARNLRMTIDKNDTPETISSQIRSVMPQASQLFVNFYASQVVTAK